MIPVQNRQSNPRWQKAYQKMMRLDDTESSILDTALIDESFADAEMRKYLQYMKMSTDKKRMTKGLALSRDWLDFSKSNNAAKRNLEAQRTGYLNDQTNISNIIGGANVLANTGIGLKEMAIKSKLAKRYPKLLLGKL